MTGPYRLYGAEISYYTGKARAYLRWKRLPFEEIVSTAEVYQNIIYPRTGVRYIPIVITPDDEALQDTSHILETLEARHAQRGITPPGGFQNLVSHLFELLGDEWLLLPAMHYRWVYNREWAYGEFGAVIVPDQPADVQRMVGEKAAKPFAGALPALGITDITGPAIEAWYLETLEQLTAHFATHPFLLGSRPCLGDFGLIGALYAHLYRDPESGKLMRAKAPAVHAYVERMMALQDAPDGEWLPDDTVPATLDPILARLFKEYFPVLADTVARTEAVIAANPDQELPRAIGMHRFRIGDSEGERAVFPYAQWMLQRVLKAHGALAGADKARAEARLAALGGLEALRIPIARPVARVNNRVVPG